MLQLKSAYIYSYAASYILTDKINVVSKIEYSAIILLAYKRINLMQNVRKAVAIIYICMYVCMYKVM